MPSIITALIMAVASGVPMPFMNRPVFGAIGVELPGSTILSVILLTNSNSFSCDSQLSHRMLKHC